jgi:hypothetical protein
MDGRSAARRGAILKSSTLGKQRLLVEQRHGRVFRQHAEAVAHIGHKLLDQIEHALQQIGLDCGMDTCRMS